MLSLLSNTHLAKLHRLRRLTVRKLSSDVQVPPVVWLVVPRRAAAAQLLLGEQVLSHAVSFACLPQSTFGCALYLPSLPPLLELWQTTSNNSVSLCVARIKMSYSNDLLLPSDQSGQLLE